MNRDVKSSRFGLEAVRLASDLAHAEEAYGEDQAVARVYALKMLRHAAEQGEQELIGRRRRQARGLNRRAARDHRRRGLRGRRLPNADDNL